MRLGGGGARGGSGFTSSVLFNSGLHPTARRAALRRAPAALLIADARARARIPSRAQRARRAATAARTSAAPRISARTTPRTPASATAPSSTSRARWCAGAGRACCRCYGRQLCVAWGCGWVCGRSGRKRDGASGDERRRRLATRGMTVVVGAGPTGSVEGAVRRRGKGPPEARRSRRSSSWSASSPTR